MKRRLQFSNTFELPMTIAPIQRDGVRVKFIPGVQLDPRIIASQDECPERAKAITEILSNIAERRLGGQTPVQQPLTCRPSAGSTGTRWARDSSGDG